MDNKQLDTLEKIVELGGDCLDHRLCDYCPFRKKCLPEFVTGKPMSQKERLNVALDTLVRRSVLDDEA